MKKTNIIFLGIFLVICALFLDIFFGRFLAVKISTIPFIKKYNLLNPSGPIVINTKEEVRVSDSEDVISAVGKVKSKLSLLVSVEPERVKILSSAVNVGSDGVFVAPKQAINSIPQNSLNVKTSDGEIVPVESVAFDPVTNLAFIKAKADNIPVASFAKINQLVSGQRIVLVSSTQATSKGEYFLGSFISSVKEYLNGVVFMSDFPTLSFGIQQVTNLQFGQTIVTLDGDVAGFWDGTTIVSGDILENSVNNYFYNKGVLKRPQFGFAYRNISNLESQILNIPTGAMVVKPSEAQPAVTIGLPADKAGLKAGDIILSVADINITEDLPLETILLRIKPGEEVSFNIRRGKENMVLKITAGELK